MLAFAIVMYKWHSALSG